MGHGLLPRLQRRVNFQNVLGIYLQASPYQGIHIAFITGLVDLGRKPPGQEADFPVFLLIQVVYGAHRTFVMAGGDAQEVLHIQDVVQQHHGDVLLTEPVDNRLAGLAHEDDAVHLFFDIYLTIGKQHVLIGHHEHAVVPAGALPHDCLQNGGIERIQHSRRLLFVDNESDVLRLLPDHGPGDGVGGIIQAFCRGVYFEFSFLTHAVRLGIGAGNGGLRIAAFLRYVNDGGPHMASRWERSHLILI